MNILEVYINLSQRKKIPESELKGLDLSPEDLKKLITEADMKESLDQVKEGLKKAVESLKLPIKEIEKEINLEDYQKLLSIARIAYVHEQNGVPEEHAAKLLYTFGSYEGAIACLKRDPNLDPTHESQLGNPQLIHDACIFALPTEEINIKFWQRLAGKYMPDYDFQKVLALAPKIESYVKENRKSLVEKHRAEIIRKYEFQLGEEWEKIEAQKKAALPSLEAYIQSKMIGEKGKLKSKIQKDINKQFSYLAQGKLKELGKISKDKKLTAEERDILKKYEASEEGQKLRKDVEAKVILELEHQFREEYEKIASPNVEKQKYIEEHLLKDKALIEETCRDAILKNASLETLLEYLPQISYKNASRNPIAAKLFFEYGIPEAEFDKYLTLKPSETSSIPEMFIDGDSIGYPGFYLKKLSSKDPKAAILGKMTSCCQWMGSSQGGADCAIHGITSPEGGFYVICQKKKGQKEPSDDDLILAQTWTWRGESNKLVFDSIESQINFRQENGQLLSDFFFLLAHKLVSEKGFPQVLLGQGASPDDLTQLNTRYCERCKDYFGYRDSRKQFVLAGKLPFYIKHYLQLHPHSTLKARLSDTIEPTIDEILEWVDICAMNAGKIGKKYKFDLLDHIPRKYFNDYRYRSEEQLINKRFWLTSEYLKILDSWAAWSIESKDLDNAKDLLEQGANMYLLSQSRRSIFHTAASRENLEMIKYLVEKRGFDVNKRDFEGNTAFLCGYDVSLNVWKYLIQSGADVNIANDEGVTPLHRAANSIRKTSDPKELEKVKILIEAGADINKADKKGFTALFYAVGHEILYLIKYLVEQGADVNITNYEGKTVLDRALNRLGENHEIVIYLKEKAKEQKEQKEKFTLTGFQRAKESKSEKETPETKREPPTRATPD